MWGVAVRLITALRDTANPPIRTGGSVAANGLRIRQCIGQPAVCKGSLASQLDFRAFHVQRYKAAEQRAVIVKLYCVKRAVAAPAR